MAATMPLLFARGKTFDRNNYVSSMWRGIKIIIYLLTTTCNPYSQEVFEIEEPEKQFSRYFAAMYIGNVIAFRKRFTPTHPWTNLKKIIRFGLGNRLSN